MTAQVVSGSTDRKLAFVAVDSTDLKTRETGLSSFTVYRSREGGTATAWTTPTVAELDATNMPGVYVLTIDEDTTLTSGKDHEQMCLHITQASMAPVTLTYELVRPKVTEGQTVTASGGSVNSACQSIAADAITASAIADGAIDAATFASGAITATVLATDAIGAAEVSAAAAAKIADIVMRRTTANVEASSDGDTLGARSLYGAVASIAHKRSISGSTLTVTKADDTTSLTTMALTSTPGADPITAIDPA